MKRIQIYSTEYLNQIKNNVSIYCFQILFSVNKKWMQVIDVIQNLVSSMNVLHTIHHLSLHSLTFCRATQRANTPSNSGSERWHWMYCVRYGIVQDGCNSLRCWGMDIQYVCASWKMFWLMMMNDASAEVHLNVSVDLRREGYYRSPKFFSLTLIISG